MRITNGVGAVIDRSAARLLAQNEWPKRADGTNKSVGEMTAVEQQTVARNAIRSLQPEFAAMGVTLEFGGHIGSGHHE